MAVSGVGAVPLTADPLQADPNSFGAAMQQEIAAASNEPTVPAPAPQAAPSSAPAEAVPTPQAPAAEQAPAAPAAPTFKFADLQAWNSSEQGRAARASLLQSMPNATEQDRELAARMMFLETNGQQLDAANTNALAQNTSQMVGGQADQLWMAQAQAFGGRYLPEEVMARMASQQAQPAADPSAQPPASESPQSSDPSVDPSLQASTAGVQAAPPPASGDVAVAATPQEASAAEEALVSAIREQYRLIGGGNEIDAEELNAALPKIFMPDNFNATQVAGAVDGGPEGSKKDNQFDQAEYEAFSEARINAIATNPMLQTQIQEKMAGELGLSPSDLTPEALSQNPELQAQYAATLRNYIAQDIKLAIDAENQSLRQ
jgi:hypothetical protein